MRSSNSCENGGGRGALQCATTKNKFFMIHSIFIYLSLLLPISLMAQKTEADFKDMLEGMYKYTVPLIQPAEIQKKGLSNYILLDTREKEEYEVSHLPGAIWTGYDHFNEAVLDLLDKDKAVVVYCSVGYRSERIGERMQKAGFTQVYNLYGGIFQWTNEGNAVENAAGEPTPKVHGYNKKVE